MAWAKLDVIVPTSPVAVELLNRLHAEQKLVTAEHTHNHGRMLGDVEGHDFHGNQYSKSQVFALHPGQKARRLPPDEAKTRLDKANQDYRDYLAAQPPVKLYHGSASDIIDAVKRDGLKPAASPGSDEWAKENNPYLFGRLDVGGREASVFVARDPENSFNYARLASEVRGGKPVVFEVHVPNDKFEEMFEEDEHDRYGLRTKGKTIPPEWIKRVGEVDSDDDEDSVGLFGFDDDEPEFRWRELAGVTVIYITILVDDEPHTLGDVTGHPFHGNQWTDEGASLELDKEGKAPGGRSTSGFVEPTAEQRKALVIPPGWTNVHVNPDPNGRLRAVGIDVKGRVQRRYSAAHSETAAGEKFNRLQEFNAALPQLRAEIEKDLTSSDPATREAATILRLVDRTAFRIGSNKETLADKKAYGTSTLEAKHVNVNGDDITFKFTGKKGVDIKKTVTDPELAAALKDRLTGGPLFEPGGDTKAREYMDRHTSGFSPKDFRTYHGTSRALKVMKNMPTPKNEAEFKKARREVGKFVAKHLGNTPAVSLNSYIDPVVFGRWKS